LKQIQCFGGEIYSGEIIGISSYSGSHKPCDQLNGTLEVPKWVRSLAPRFIRIDRRNNEFQDSVRTSLIEELQSEAVHEHVDGNTKCKNGNSREWGDHEVVVGNRGTYPIPNGWELIACRNQTEVQGVIKNNQDLNARIIEIRAIQVLCDARILELEHQIQEKDRQIELDAVDEK